ncbi:M23 family metallopeptidase [Gemmatimonadota bacterium]
MAHPRIAAYLIPLFFYAWCLLPDPATLHAQAGGSSSSDLTWPAAADPAMTSAFGEFRPGHVHAGLDVKTWGRIGVPMIAVADGEIRRIRTSPWGYGRALYVELADGRTAVYAHLDHFTEDVEELVRERQQTVGRYTVDLWLARGERPVKRGDVLAFSGDTASTAPHLHFELRDADNEPVNPLRNGLQVRDTQPPTIRALVVRPTGEEGELDGHVRVRSYGALPDGKGRYRLRGRPEITDGAALSLVVHDLMDAVWNRFGPYRLVLAVDGSETFEVRYDRFSYEESELANLDRDYRYMVNEGVRAHTLYRRTGNTLPFYSSNEEGTGYLQGLTPGLHQVVVVAEDAAGNASRLEGQILVNRPPVIRTSRRDGSGAPGTGGLLVEGTDPDAEAVRLALEVATENGWSERSHDDGGNVEGSMTVAQEVLDRLSDEGVLALRFRGEDPWGRASRSAPIRLPLAAELPEEAARPRPSAATGAGEGRAALDIERYERWLILTSAATQGAGAHVVFEVTQPGLQPRVLEGVLLRDGRFEAHYPLRPANEEGVTVRAVTMEGSRAVAAVERILGIVPLPPDRSGRYLSSDGGLVLSYPAGTFYETEFLQEGPESSPGPDASTGLVPLSRVYVLGPEDILFRGTAEIRLRVGPLPAGVEGRQIGLYTRVGSADEPRWVFLGGDLRDAGGANGQELIASVGGFGPFAVLADTAAPAVELRTPRDGGRVRSSRPRIEYAVEDLQSGISDDRQLVLRLNGTQAIARYDPQRDRLLYEPHEDLEPGIYFLTLDVTDVAGNLRQVTSSFTVITDDAKSGVRPGG